MADGPCFLDLSYISRRLRPVLTICIVWVGFTPEPVSGQCYSDGELLLASDGTSADNAGTSVAVSGDVMVVGAPGDSARGSDSGSAYVFRLGAQSWAEQEKLFGSDTAADSKFGASVAASGNVVVIGAAGQGDFGAAYVFRFDGSTWQEEAVLMPSDGVAGDKFGRSVVASGNAVLIGAYGVDQFGTSSGAAYVFRYNGSQWRQEQKLFAPDAAASDFFAATFAVYSAFNSAIILSLLAILAASFAISSADFSAKAGGIAVPIMTIASTINTKDILLTTMAIFPSFLREQIVQAYARNPCK